MPDPLLIAQMAEADGGGHAHYRAGGPGRAMAALPGVTVVDCDPRHRLMPWLVEEADVLVLHGVHPDLPPAARRRRDRGRVTVFEASDDYFDLQTWTDRSAAWLDRARRDQFWQLVAAADAVQTSTPALAELWSPKARAVFVVPNDLGPVPPLPPPRDGRPLTVGWAGSATHLADWLAFAPTLRRWVAGRGGVRLAVMADESARGYVRLPADRYHFRPPGTLAEYEAFLGTLDVAVVPLLPSPFNRGRTDLKFRELAARGVPGVFADAGPYRCAVEHGRTGLLFRTPAELVRGLDALADDPALRRSIRAAAHAHVAGGADSAGDRLAAYRRLLPGPGRCPPLQAELVAAAVSEARYHRLDPGPPEVALGCAARRPPDNGQVASLGRLVAAYPDFHAATRQLGRVLNDLGRFGEAVAALEPARLARPDGPATLVESARARLGRGDPAAARALLDRAVASNSAYAPAWDALLRLAGTDEAAALAERARRNQPASYVAALAAVKYAAPESIAAALAGWLGEFAAGLHADERPYAAAAFGEAVAARLDLDAAPAAPLLAAACGHFPDSARLADRHGEALYAAGREGEALAEWGRALGLVRAALTMELEGSAAGDRPRHWRVAEAARRHGGGADGP